MNALHPISRLFPGRRRRARDRRRGVAVVETALCVPMLLAFAFATVELCNLLHLRQRMLTAAYESARFATRPTTATTQSATAAQVTARCQSILTQFGVQDATITLSPSSLTSVAPQTAVTVTVSAPLSTNSPTSFLLGNSQTVSAQATLIFE